MQHAVVLTILFLVIIAATDRLAARIRLPPAIVQTVAGVLLAFVPGFPAVHLDPDFVLLAVLPVLVYASAAELPWEDFRSNARPITTLAFGLVIATVAAVAAVALLLIPGLPLAAALALGAIVSPTDPVASSAITARIGVPRRLVAIIEGEGLVNDAVALTINAIAVGALLGGTLAISAAALRFTAIVIGEVAWGVALGWMAAALRKRIHDSSTEIVVTFVTPFAAYLVPHALGGSGVLATVATGMYIGEQWPELVPFGTRLHLASVWQVIVYGLNGALFLLAGLQFRFIWESERTGPVLLYGAAIAATAIVVRLCWTWAAAWLTRAILPNLRRRDPMPPPRQLAFIGWSGMRGTISLAAALSLPHSVASRNLIVFITACVIAATLLVQGTTLPWLIRWLRLDRDAATEKDETRQSEIRARRAVAKAAVEALRGEDRRVADQLRRSYEAIATGGAPARSKAEANAEAELRQKAIAAGRQCLVDMHRNREIADLVMRRIERELDLQEALLENRLGAPE